MARFYSNENFPLPVVGELRRLGHDVLTLYEAGQANQAVPDEAVLQTASDDNRILLTGFPLSCHIRTLRGSVFSSRRIARSVQIYCSALSCTPSRAGEPRCGQTRTSLPMSEPRPTR